MDDFFACYCKPIKFMLAESGFSNQKNDSKYNSADEWW